jgi:serine protease Do
MNGSTPARQPARTVRAGMLKISPRTLIAGAVALALASGGIVLAQVNTPDTGPGQAQPQTQATIMPSFADVATRVTPAVVNVMVVGERVGSADAQDLPDLPDGTPFDEFFHHFFQQPHTSGPHHTEGLGSGFLVDADGYIVTNNHVVDGADEVRVTLHDGSKYKARVVGRDDKTDLALIKIDAGHALPYVELSQGTKARVGDWVLAVGNPFGLGGSVSAGIVSAEGRDIHSGPYDDYIQVDAPINRGNSGGPLFDAQGHLLGVNTAIYSPTGGSVGIGFAIPADTVRTVVADLRTDGRVDRGWLGVEIQPVTDDLAAALGLKDTSGVLVAGVMPDGPAAQTDLQPGDVIRSAGGQPIKDYKDLPRLVAATKAGTSLTLEVVRNGKPLEIVAKVGAMPDDQQQAERTPDTKAANGPRLGLYLVPLTPQLRREQGLDAGTTGVLVSKVEPDSPADRAGIEPGTLISMVGGQPVTTPKQVIAAVRKAAEEKQGAVLLRIQKDGNSLFVAVPFAA